MPTYLSPGVYVEEIPSGSKPIEGVATAVAAFIGSTYGGTDGDVTLVQSFSEYEDAFAAVQNEADAMGLAVSSFFQNGGRKAFICKLAAKTAAATSTKTVKKGSANAFKIDAIRPGAWGDEVKYRIVDSVTADKTFTLELGHDVDSTFTVIERFPKLNTTSGDPFYVETQLNGKSRLVVVEDLSPGDGSVFPNDSAAPVALAGGKDIGLPDDSAYQTLFDTVLIKQREVTILALPGQAMASDGSGNVAINHAINHCESTKSRMVVVDPPGTTELRKSSDVETLALPTSTYSVLYYPWLTISNPFYDAETSPIGAPTLEIAPSAMAAGMWSRVDGRRGVWKAPAGVEARVRGIAGLEYDTDAGEQEALNPLGVNAIRKMPGFGQVVWGARTLATKADPEWRYVPVRRTAIFIEQSIYDGIQWAVFEPNNHLLWSALRLNIEGFMGGLFRSGAFQGEKSSDAFFVRCGLGDTMTQADIDAGQVIAIVGFAPLKPAEFVIVRIQQKVGEE